MSVGNTILFIIIGESHDKDKKSHYLACKNLLSKIISNMEGSYCLDLPHDLWETINRNAISVP